MTENEQDLDYLRTTVMNGVVTPMKRGGDDYHYFFIADEMVSKDEYLKRAGVLTETSE